MRTPEALPPSALAQLLELNTDLALELDADDVVRATAVRAGLTWSALVGCKWVDTVKPEHRSAARELLRQARADQAPREVELEQYVPGEALTRARFRFSALSQAEGRVWLLGHDCAHQRPLHALNELAQRSRAELEARDHLLFRLSTEPLLVIDVRAMQLVACNPSAATLFALTEEALAHRELVTIFDAEGVAQLTALCWGRVAEAKVTLHGRPMTVTASSWNEAGVPRLLLRLQPLPRPSALDPRDARLFSVLEGLSDAVVVIGHDRQVLSANPACGALLGYGEDELIGLPVDRWLGRTPPDVTALITALQARGSVRHFATVVRPASGLARPVSISGVVGTDEHGEFFGLSVRPNAAPVDRLVPLPGAVAQLRELVGRVSLKRIVAESSALVEQLCIEAALRLTPNDLAATAQMLGISRQTLAVKLRKYGPK